jgi:hypothetical protein
MLLVGIALIAGSTMAAILMVSGSTVSREANVHRYDVRAWYQAEGAIEEARRQLTEAIASFQDPPAKGVATIDGQAVAFEIAPTGFADVDVDEAGIQTIVTGYHISATAQVEEAQSTAHRIVNVEATPLFQFAVFYDGDLEIFPGPNMTIGGRVHTNADMYLGSGGTLTMDTNYVRAIGEIYRRRKDDPTQSPGTVSVRSYVEDPFDPSEPSNFVTMNSKSQMTSAGVATTSGYDSDFAGWDDDGDADFYGSDDWLPWLPGALDYWSEPDGYTGSPGHTVMSGVHGTSEAVPPGVGSIAMFEPATGGDYDFDAGSGTYVEVAPGTGAYNKGYYHAAADLSVLAEEDGTFVAYDGDGNDVTASVASAVTVSTLLDTRQSGGTATKIGVVEIDVELLNASGVFPANGLLYAASYGAGTGTDAKGVVLKNGSELHGPLTVATENSVYIKGDYNTDEKVGAAVLADSVNLLSNAWDGSKGTGTLPKATATTYNVAFCVGNNETSGSAYNGGFENLPRFHENWTNIDCNMNGSFVNAWPTVHATGAWVYGGNRYTAPKRKYTYDAEFNEIANLPPFTPMAISADDVVIW